MSVQPATIVQRLWNYCNVLRDDGARNTRERKSMQGLAT